MNGILQVGSVVDLGGTIRLCKVSKLEFNGRSARAFAGLTSLEIAECFLCVPAVVLSLQTPEYLKYELTDILLTDAHEVNKAFALYSSVKRAVGLSRSVKTFTYPLGPATDMAKRILGVTTKEKVNIYRFRKTAMKIFARSQFRKTALEKCPVLNSAKQEKIACGFRRISRQQP